MLCALAVYGLSAGAVVSYLSADATSLNTLHARLSGNRIEFRDETVDGGMDPGNCTPGAGTLTYSAAPYTVTLTARHEGGSIVVRMSDDGAGLDRARPRDR